MNLPTRDSCCGCSACASVCPKTAIKMKCDNEGFLQPTIDTDKCVACGMCERVCPVLNSTLVREPIGCYAAKSKDFDERKKSSSGGIFSLLARYVLANGGVVFGAAWSDKCAKVIHVKVDNVANLHILRESKYVQSEIGASLIDCKCALECGKQVLFSGCPCQIAGLKMFLGRDYDNLFTQELICNSVPSPRALEAWVEAEKKKRPKENVVAIHFRDKKAGWHNATLKFQFTTTTTTALLRSTYYKLWQSGFTVRRSCIECKFRDFKSGADLTIGDFWGIEKVFPEFDDNNGVSAVLVNTAKGRLLWEGVRGNTTWKEATYSSILSSNPCLAQSFPCLKDATWMRDGFWKAVNAGGDIQALGIIYTREPLFSRVKGLVCRILLKCGLRARR